MKKLLLETILLCPLSTRDVPKFLQQHTLPASEIQCGTGWVTQVPPKSSEGGSQDTLLPSQESLTGCLNLCGFAALKSLAAGKLVSQPEASEGERDSSRPIAQLPPSSLESSPLDHCLEYI